MAESEASLRQRFDVVEERFAHGDVALTLIRPRDADALIDEEAFARDERLPYWAELWPAAKGLARWIIDGGLDVRKGAPSPSRLTPTFSPEGSGDGAARVLEVGCGVGLAALAAAARGLRVVATDYYEEALRFVEANAARNGLPGVETRVLDWRHRPRGLGTSAVVLAADVLYEARHARDLAAALPSLVSAGGRAIVADPGRKYRGVLEEAMRAQGWAVREIAKMQEPAARGAVSVVTLIELRAAGL